MRIALDDRDATSAQEFFRWEIATAVAGAIIGINPFDQPDVEASKIATRELTERVREDRLAARRRRRSSRATGCPLFADERNAGGAAAGDDALRAATCRRISAASSDGDYVALLAYIAR